MRGRKEVDRVMFDCSIPPDSQYITKNIHLNKVDVPCDVRDLSGLRSVVSGALLRPVRLLRQGQIIVARSARAMAVIASTTTGARSAKQTS